jgi:uncharacterized protein YhbP (UPF0306 family)
MNELQKHEIVVLMEREADSTIVTISPDGLPHATTVSYVNDGLILYLGTSLNSQKVTNVDSNSNVSLTINSPYRYWKDIAGVSISGLVSRVQNSEEFKKVGILLFEKFPQVNDFAKAENEDVALFRIEPKTMLQLNYRKGFGHTERRVL